MEHFATIKSAIDSDVNLNKLTEIEHGKELKQVFVKRALPVFVITLIILEMATLLVFLEETFHILSKTIGKIMKCLKIGLEHTESVFKEHKKISVFTIIAIILSLLIGIFVFSIIINSSPNYLLKHFGENFVLITFQGLLANMPNKKGSNFFAKTP